MKRILVFFALISGVLTFAQNIRVDNSTYTPQQLIEDILIDSACIDNVLVTNVVGGNFNGTDQSYGFFDATGTSFPFENGIVLSTGRLANVEGPNDSLSDDDAPNWNGDTDLETILNEANTLNATILEFDFTSAASQISFKYVFASEEYQEGDPNTCRFSDLFGFLIRPQGTQQYTNIAIVPDTQTPVKVTTVHPGIPGSCDPINEAYFESFNGTVSPINFNGQTKILTATADVIPNQAYHVKLVIADEQNFRFDSAVFLEAGSFQLSTDLGPDLLFANGTAPCENEIVTISAFEPGLNRYSWYVNGVLTTIFSGDNNGSSIEASVPGIYSVEIELQGTNCISYGEVIIEFASNPIVADSSVIQCDLNTDGLTIFNLEDNDLIDAITISNNSLFVSNYFLSETDAEMNIDQINIPQGYNNTSVNQTIFARVENQYGCFSIAEVQLTTSNNSIAISPLTICDDETRDGISTFDLVPTRFDIELASPPGSVVLFYNSLNDGLLEVNQISINYENQTPNSETIYARVNDGINCHAIIPIQLNVFENPELSDSEEMLYCLNDFPITLTLNAGILNDSPSNYNYQWLLNGNDIFQNSSSISINETGTYTVIATNNNGCSSTRGIIVLPSNIATIDDVSIVEATSNNTVTVQVSGEGNYEYAIDIGGPFQDSNILTNVEPGFHTVVIRDKNGCGIIEHLISVLGFPKFFTPNGDSYNDTWKPKGVNAQFNATIKVIIFDRYGKLIKEINPLGTGWNGTYNGTNLPPNDYWFTVTLGDGKVYSGHFALKR